MIIIKLQCDYDHTFEGWFKNDAEYKRQQQSRMISCPSCGSTNVLDSNSENKEATAKQMSIDTSSVVSHQEIKMISEQFISNYSNAIKEPFYYIKNGKVSSSGNNTNEAQYFDSFQNEVKDLSEESLATVLSYLKDISKDKLN